jgi:hypothetical protein
LEKIRVKSLALLEEDHGNETRFYWFQADGVVRKIEGSLHAVVDLDETERVLRTELIFLDADLPDHGKELPFDTVFATEMLEHGPLLVRNSNGVTHDIQWLSRRGLRIASHSVRQANVLVDQSERAVGVSISKSKDS